MMALLFVIVIGGLWYPLLGYIVVAMMAFFLTLSVFRSRYWCWHLCPRGSFLDIALSKVSRQKTQPRFVSRIWFRSIVFIGVMGFFVYRLRQTGGDIIAIGAVFVSMCLITTIIAIILGIVFRHRMWCSFCPMGFLQERLGSISAKKKIKDHK